MAKSPKSAPIKPSTVIISTSRLVALEAVARTAEIALDNAELNARSDFAFVKHRVPEMDALRAAIIRLRKP